MKIRKVSQDEVTVYLSEQELGGFDIKPGEKMPESAALHRFLFELMDTVYNETGFNPYGGQVIVEATPLQNGMSLTISKARREKKGLTKEEFKKAKRVRVKPRELDLEELSSLSQEDILGIVEDITARRLKREREKHAKKKGVFLFSCFKDMESALCAVPSDAVGGCSLYRNQNRYAIVSDYAVGSKYYNMLSEFSEKVVSTEIAAADIKEGWMKIADNEELFKMAEAVCNMQ